MTAAIPRAQRPRALYCNLSRLTQDRLIGEWWIETAGGISVTNNGRTAESVTFSLEQLFAWDPDTLIVASPADLEETRRDARFRKLKAVAAGRVYVAPIAAHRGARFQRADPALVPVFSLARRPAAPDPTPSQGEVALRHGFNPQAPG